MTNKNRLTMRQTLINMLRAIYKNNECLQEKYKSDDAFLYAITHTKNAKEYKEILKDTKEYKDIIK